MNASQTSNVLPLAFDLVPDGYRPGVTRNLVQNIRFHGYHPVTGIMGTQFLLDVLSKNGAHDVACKLISQRTFPSWGYMLDKGATTIWERWDSDWSVEPMNSRNHPAFGAVGQWLYNTLAGIRPSEKGEGFQRFTIAPRLHPDLDFVRSRHHSLYGDIGVSWNRLGNGLAFELEIPANTEARVILPTEGKQVHAISESGKEITPGAGAKSGINLTFENGMAQTNLGSGRYTFEIGFRAMEDH
jgi:alpha-L-rhamnosidase